LGNEIASNAQDGVAVMGGRKKVIGSATAGNAIGHNGQNGLYVMCDVTGTRVEGNGIDGNAGNGVVLASAWGLTVGGRSPGTGNGIIGNQSYGLLAYGLCAGSVVQGNVIVANGAGNVNLTQSRGIVYIP